LSNQIKSNLFCHKFSTQYNNEFALHLAGQTGDNFALMSAEDVCFSSLRELCVLVKTTRNVFLMRDSGHAVVTRTLRQRSVDDNGGQYRGLCVVYWLKWTSAQDVALTDGLLMLVYLKLNSSITFY